MQQDMCSGQKLIKNNTINTSASKIEKFYFWIDLKTKKWNCSCVKSLWVAVDFQPVRGVVRLSFKLTVVTWYGSPNGQASRAAMRQWNTIVSVLPGWQVNYFQVPLKEIWPCIIWEDHEHARELRKFLTKKVTVYFLAHPIDQKMWSSVWIFKVGFFPKFLNFLEHLRGCFLGLQLRQKFIRSFKNFL